MSSITIEGGKMKPRSHFEVLESVRWSGIIGTDDGKSSEVTRSLASAKGCKRGVRKAGHEALREGAKGV